MVCIDGDRPGSESRSGGKTRVQTTSPLTAVHTKNPVVDDHREGQKVEHVREVLPHIRVPVLARTLRVETIRLRHAARLVVASDQVYAIRVS